MRKLYALIAGILIVSIVLFFFHWDTVFVSVQETFYQMYYSKEVKSAKSRIDVKTFNSKLFNNTPREVRIYIPKAYDQTHVTRFPTVYLLHGYPGNNKDWLINTNLQTKLDLLIQNGTIPPMIVVFPDGNGPIVHDSQYLDATEVQQPMESHIVKELVPFIDTHYRTDARREKRAIGGISSGAYGAVNMGLRNNDVFGFLFSHSGYFINREAVLPSLLGTKNQIIQENNPIDYMMKKKINTKTYIYFDIGNDDSPLFIHDNTSLNTVLQQRHIPHRFIMTGGWHNWNVWADNVASSLQQYAHYLKKGN